MRMVFGLLVVAGLVGGGVAYYVKYVRAEPPASFRTTAVKRGNLLATIGATGTVEPEEVVDVGAQVVGRIKTLGIDPTDPQKKRPIDYCSTVQEGTVLAQIDEAIYKAQVAQAQASLARAKADLEQLKAKRVQAKQEWERAKSLVPSKAIADTDFDLTEADYKAAEVFRGKVVQVRYNATMTQNVVTYTVVIETKNPDLKLIPYLTANVQFEVEDGMEVVTGVARTEQAGDATSNPFAPQLFRSKAKQ